MISKKRVNILQLVTQMELGGAQKMMLQIANGLPREKYNVYVACLYTKNNLNPLPQEFGLDVADFHFKENRDLPLTQKTYLFITGLYKLYNFLKQNKIQIVQTYCYYANIIGAIAAKCANVPIIITSQRISYRREPKIKIVIDRLCANLVPDKIVAVSDAVKDFSISKEGFRASKLVTIRNGIDLSNIDSKITSIEEKRKRLGISANHIVLATVARLHIRKGHIYLLKAMQNLNQRKDLILFLVGDGDEKENLVTLSNRLDISDKVHFLGWRNDVSEILDCIDIFVLPSLEEGFPNVIIEAMSKSKPIIATDVDGNPEAVVDGYNGIIVPPKDPQSLAEAILELVHDENKRIQFGHRSRKIVEDNFDLKKIIDKYEKLYESLAKQKLKR